MNGPAKPCPDVVASVLETSAASCETAIAAVSGLDVAIEIRADRISADEVASLVRRCPRPVVVTARSPGHGGDYAGGFEDRRVLWRSALDAGAARVDVEWDGSGPTPEAAGVEAGRAIVSHHGGPCDRAVLARTCRAMREAGWREVKLVPRAVRGSDVGEVRAFLERARATGDREVCAFATERAGRATRVMALAWGSSRVYGSAVPGRAAAPGQIDVSDLLDTHGVRSIGPGTVRYGLVGVDLSHSPSPAMHRAAYRDAGLDAVYVPLEGDTLDDALAVAVAVGVERFGATMPFKLEAAARCDWLDPWSRRSGSVNTVIGGSAAAKRGFDTDAFGAWRAVATAMRSGELAPGERALVVGSGGTARACAVAFERAGLDVVVASRSERPGRAVARAVRGTWVPWDRIARCSVSAVAVAVPPHVRIEAPRARRFVLDAAYGRAARERTATLSPGARRVVDGVRMLALQGTRQCAVLSGVRADSDRMEAAARAWLDGRA